MASIQVTLYFFKQPLFTFTNQLYLYKASNSVEIQFKNTCIQNSCVFYQIAQNFVLLCALHTCVCCVCVCVCVYVCVCVCVCVEATVSATHGFSERAH